MAAGPQLGWPSRKSGEQAPFTFCRDWPAQWLGPSSESTQQAHHCDTWISYSPSPAVQQNTTEWHPGKILELSLKDLDIILLIPSLCSYIGFDAHAQISRASFPVGQRLRAFSCAHVVLHLFIFPIITYELEVNEPRIMERE